MPKHLLRILYPDQQPKNFFQRWKSLLFEESPYLQIVLQLPKKELLRLQTFIDDINELNHELDFSLEDLIAFLYNNLLQDSRNGKLKYSKFADKLLAMYQNHHKPHIQVSWKQVSANHLTRIEEAIPRKQSYMNYPIHIKKKHVLRGEVLLMDLYEEQKEKIGITVADMISLQLIEFADEIRKGPTQKRIQSIIKTSP